MRYAFYNRMIGLANLKHKIELGLINDLIVKYRLYLYTSLISVIKVLALCALKVFPLLARIELTAINKIWC